MGNESEQAEPSVPAADLRPVWWVNQGQTYGLERDGGYIWAPQKTKRGNLVRHHTAVGEVVAGDRIVHYSKGCIRAVGVATSDGTEGQKPSELPDESWQAEGFTARVDYHELQTPIPLTDLDLQQRQGKGPFTSAGAVQQGYLYRLPPELGRYLAALLDNTETAPPPAGKLWVVYVGQQSVPNLRHSLPSGKWGWRQKQDNYDEFEPGDTIAFSVGYTGGSPRTDFEHFQDASFEELVLCRVTSGIAEETQPYWPDEVGEVVYPYRVEVSEVDVVRDVDISTLDERYGGEVADSFRLSAINQSRAILVEGASVDHADPGPPVTKEKVIDVEPAPFSEVVSSFAKAATTSGLDYGERHDELIGSFISALATKPFVILTGLSGSGKTRLALAFGQWLGDDSVLVVPVRPDWTSPDSLLGYEDALAAPSKDGKQRWVVPKTLEFILRAADDQGTPYVLVLDEMNLAHVERYFADVLSGMESGQDVVPDLVRGDDGEYRARLEAGGLRALPDNLFVVGTVNVDETTYMFSPKVLDRANTFEFRVQSSDLGTETTLDDVPPATAEMAAGILQAARSDPGELPDGDTFEANLRSLHELLSKHDREFGHRTYHEAIRFARRFSELERDPGVALDLQVLQKVLPRLHGSRRELTAVLNDLGAWCYNGPGVESTGSFDTATTEPALAKLPSSYDKLHRMAKRLRDRHFVSFAE